MSYKVVGNLSDIHLLRKMEPSLSVIEIEQILGGRTFAQWYFKNKKTINTLALLVPGFTLALFGLEPQTTSILLDQSATVTAYAPIDSNAVPVAGGGGYSFWSGHGAILLHMLIVGFVTLVITTFLKFTGRGDIAPLVVFVGGGIILYEVIGLFQAIYQAVAAFFNM